MAIDQGNSPVPAPVTEQPRLQIPLIGLRRSGKSSMLNVVYNDLHPDDTLFLESTLKAVTVKSDSFLPITLTDMPGGILLGGNRKLDHGLPLSSSAQRPSAPSAHAGLTANAGVPASSPVASASTSTPAVAPTAPPVSTPDLLAWTDVSAVIFVIDAQDDYFEALSKLQSVIVSAFAQNQTIDFHVFIHKIDGFSDDYRQDTLGDIRAKVLDDLVDSSRNFIPQPWSFPPPTRGRGATFKDHSKGGSGGHDFGALGSSPALGSRGSGGHPDGSGSGANNASTGGRAASGGGAGATGTGYDASASDLSLFSGGGARRNGGSVPVAGQINLETAVRIHFHLTSIFDTSVFVAFSKVQHSLMQKTCSVETTVVSPDALAAPPSASKSEGALLHPSSAATQARTGSELHPKTSSSLSPTSGRIAPHPKPTATLAEAIETLCDSICASCKFDKAFLFDLPTRTFVGADSTPFDAASFDVIFEYAGFLSKFAGLYANVSDIYPTPPGSAVSNTTSTHTFPTETDAPTPIRRLATSVARLGPETSLAFWQIDDQLSLIAILKTEIHARQSGLIDYNVLFFQRAVVKLREIVRSGA